MVRQRNRPSLSLFAALALATPAPVPAHPLGNFNISQYTAIQIERDAIALHYFVDMAEIPTFQELQSHESSPTRPIRDCRAISGTRPTR